MKVKNKFWQFKNLEQMTALQREQICDGCGRCCLQKLEDIDSGETCFTRVACYLLDIESCRCTDYANRIERVDDCTEIFPMTSQKKNWLPSSCSYLCIERGENLPEWHHLNSGSQENVRDAGISITDWAISERYIDECLFEELIIDIDSL